LKKCNHFFFRCQAFGGRPTPEFYWFVENNNNDPILSSDGFQVRNENKKRLTKSNSELEIFLIAASQIEPGPVEQKRE
jgi:hypothetical protein